MPLEEGQAPSELPRTIEKPEGSPYEFKKRVTVPHQRYQALFRYTRHPHLYWYMGSTLLSPAMTK